MPESTAPGPLFSRSFVGLLGAQFLSAFNDQALHAAAMFFAINSQTMTERDAISLMPILFYAPWAIFCTLAGWAADKYSKRSALVIWKFAEVLMCAVALVGFGMGSQGYAWGPWVVLGCVFLMGMHAAFFGPAKYGIMPELMPPHLMSKGNGILESLSFFAVIVGTVSGGVMSFLFLRQEHWIGVVLLVLAVVGAVSSLLIKPVPASNPHRPFPPYLYGPIVPALKLMWRSPGLKVAIVGIAFFTFVVAFMRASVYMLGESQSPRWDELKTSAVVGTVALGIGLGSPLAGWISGRTIRLGLVMVGGAGMALGCLAGAAFMDNVPVLIVSIVGLGFFTGFYLVPLFTLLQRAAPKPMKGEMVATSNFVDVSGAILASLLFFGVVYTAQWTGLVPEVTDRVSLGEGTLTRLDLVRGRPAYFEVTTANGVVTGGTVAAEGDHGLSGIANAVFGGTGPTTVVEVEKRVRVNDAVAVSKFAVAGVTHFDLVPAGVIPAADYDLRRLPRFLFVGAAIMIVISLLWLARPVRRVDVESLQGSETPAGADVFLN
jgi:MFS family permease